MATVANVVLPAGLPAAKTPTLPTPKVPTIVSPLVIAPAPDPYLPKMPALPDVTVAEE